MTLFTRLFFAYARRTFPALPPTLARHARPLVTQPRHARPQHTGKPEREKLNDFLRNLEDVLRSEKDPKFVETYIHRRLDKFRNSTQLHDVFSRVISFLVERLRLRDATTVFERMLHKNFLPSHQTQTEMTAVALALSESDTEIQGALNAIALDPGSTEDQLLHLLETLDKLGVSSDHRERVATVFVNSRGEGYVPSRSMLMRVVGAQTRAGKLDDALETTLRFNEEDQPAPYAIIMHALKDTHTSDWGAYEKVLNTMKVQGVAPDITVFNALISRELLRNSLLTGFSLYRLVLQLHPTALNAGTFAPLFKLLAKTYKPSERSARRRARHRAAEGDSVVSPRELLHTMLIARARNPNLVPVTAALLNTVLRAFVYTYDYAGAVIVLGLFRHFEVQPGMRTFAMVMRHVEHRVRVDVRMWRASWGGKFVTMRGVEVVRKISVDGEFAERVLQAAGRMVFDLEKGVLRGKGRDLGVVVPTWAMMKGEEEVPEGVTFDLLPLERILRRAAWAAMEGGVGADARVEEVIETAKKEMVPEHGEETGGTTTEMDSLPSDPVSTVD